jgi:hypothetical protein
MMVVEVCSIGTDSSSMSLPESVLALHHRDVMQMYVFSKRVSNSAQYVTPDSKIYCEKVPKSPSFALLYKCCC